MSVEALISLQESSENDIEICLLWGDAPCAWERYKETILSEKGKLRSIGRLHNIIRKSIYRMYIYQKYSHIRKGIRINISICVYERICEQWPDPDKKYMGHKDK